MHTLVSTRINLSIKWRALIRGGVNSIPLSKKYYRRDGAHQTLTGSKVPEDSSDFDDSVCVLIVMTWSLIWATLRFFRPKLISDSRQPIENYFPTPAVRPNLFFPNPAGRSFLVKFFNQNGAIYNSCSIFDRQVHWHRHYQPLVTLVFWINF